MSASITKSGIKRESMGRVKVATAPVVFSGTYTASGDTLDISAMAPDGFARIPFDTKVEGHAGFEYRYDAGTTPANGKIRIFTNSTGGTNGAMTEHSAATVVGGVTGDTIKITAYFSNRI